MYKSLKNRLKGLSQKIEDMRTTDINNFIKNHQDNDAIRWIATRGMLTWPIKAVLGLSLLVSLHSCYRLGTLEDELIKSKIKVENVMGNSEPETFYEVNGQKVYLKIDGKYIENYVGGK